MAGNLPMGGGGKLNGTPGGINGPGGGTDDGPLP